MPNIFQGKNQLFKQVLHGKLMIGILKENANRLDTFDDRKLTDLTPIYQDLTTIGKRTDLSNNLKETDFPEPLLPQQGKGLPMKRKSIGPEKIGD